MTEVLLLKCASVALSHSALILDLWESGLRDSFESSRSLPRVTKPSICIPTNGGGTLVGMSRLPAARLVISITFLVPAILRAQPANLTEENRHTDGRSRFVHRINIRA